MDAWWWKRLKGNQWSNGQKNSLHKKNMTSAQMLTVNPKQASLTRGFGGKLQDVEVVIQALYRKYWNPYNKVLNHLADSLYPCVLLLETIASVFWENDRRNSWDELWEEISRFSRLYYWIYEIYNASF